MKRPMFLSITKTIPILFRSLSNQIPAKKNNTNPLLRRYPANKRIGFLNKMEIGGNPIFQRVLQTPELKILADVFNKYGHEIRFAGGPVRDILAGIEPKDLDFATTATPDQMKEMFEKEQIRVINALGEKHGTITARINDKEQYEVTTLRIDRVTDGRRAEVEYTTDWQLDAGRRDLTINSMFLDLKGGLYDYHEGVKDLENKRIRFVGTARERIQEDYLRILRYFRFHGRIANDPNAHEEETTKAISENVQGLEIVSGERIWMEWKKILEGKFGGELTLKMIELGLAPHIGLPREPNTKRFQDVYELSLKNGVKLLPLAYLAALLENEKEMLELYERLKFSGFERDLGLFVIQNRNLVLNPNHGALWPYQCKVVDAKVPKQTKIWVTEVLKYRGELELASEMEKWEIPIFPVNGHDLIAAGCPKGKLMSVILTKLKDNWKSENFKTSRDNLLGLISGILDQIDITQYPDPSPKKKSKKS